MFSLCKLQVGLFLPLFFFALSLVLSAFDTCIQVNGGVPQICVDGLPVPARWCYARTQLMAPWVSDRSCVPYSSLTLLAEPRRWERDFVAQADSESELSVVISLHEYLQAKEELEVWIDDFSLVDITEGSVIISECHFESSEENVFDWYPKDLPTYRVDWSADGGVGDSGALKITWSDIVPRAPEHGEHIYTPFRKVALKEGHEYRVSFWSNATDSARMDIKIIPLPGGALALREKYDVMQSTVKLAHESGVDFVSTMVDFPWPREGEKEDWSIIDTTLSSILAVNPEAKIVPRMVCKAPLWWLEEHPDEMTGWAEGSVDNHPPLESFSSRLWRQESEARLRRIIEHIEERFGKNIAGYHACPGPSEECFYGNYLGSDCPGFGVSEVNAWREWLTKRYTTDQGLREAWHDDSVSLDTVQAVSPSRRKEAAKVGILLEPSRFQDVIDQNFFFNDMVSEVIGEYASVIRDVCGKKRLSLFFYGYTLEVSNTSTEGMSGHFALNKILANPDVDILCSPLSYFDRLEGGVGGVMAPVESALRSGKMWMIEDDSRTYLAASGDLATLPDYLRTQQSSRQVLLRDNAHELIRNLGCWWMDLASWRWFEDSALWEIMATGDVADRMKLAAQHPYTPEVAIVVDERDYAYSIDAVSVRAPLFAVGRQAAARLGTSVGHYLLEDVLARGLSHAKLAVMLDAWALSAEDRLSLKERLAGKFVLWCYAPGLLDTATGLNPDHTLELTGFRIRQKSGNFQEVRATQDGILAGFPDSWRMDGPIRQVTAVIPQAGDRVLATWPDGDAAIVLRENALYNATSTLSWPLLRLAAKEADIHLYTNRQCVFYSDGEFHLVHATEDGSVTLAFPQTVKQVLDAMSMLPLAEKTNSITFDLHKGDTRFILTKSSLP